MVNTVVITSMVALAVVVVSLVEEVAVCGHCRFSMKGSDGHSNYSLSGSSASCCGTQFS